MAASETDTGAFTLDHMSIMVANMDDSVGWYATMLNAQVLDRWSNEENGMEWCRMALGDFLIQLVHIPDFGAHQPGTYGYHHLALRVADCDSFLSALAAKGVEIVREPMDFERHAIRWAFVKDIGGNIIEIIGPMPGAADAA